MVKKVAYGAGLVVVTLVVLHFVAPAAMKKYLGTT